MSRIEWDEHRALTILTLEGRIDPTDLVLFVRRLPSAGVTVRVLCDARTAHADHLTEGDARMVGAAIAESAALLPATRVALLTPADVSPAFGHIVGRVLHACRGPLRVRTFTDRGAALSWATSARPSSARLQRI